MNFEIGGPIQIPIDPAQGVVYLADRLQQIYAALKNLEAALFKFRAAAPEKPREGDLAAADGTNWNPGAGKGLYEYVDSLWAPLGIKQADWTALTLENGWEAYEGFYTPAYFKDERGWVWVRGTIRNGVYTTGTVLFTLPSGCRPEYTISFIVPCDATAVWGRVIVESSGAVKLQNASGNSFLYLNPIFFKV